MVHRWRTRAYTQHNKQTQRERDGACPTLTRTWWLLGKAIKYVLLHACRCDTITFDFSGRGYARDNYDIIASEPNIAPSRCMQPNAHSSVRNCLYHQISSPTIRAPACPVVFLLNPISLTNPFSSALLASEKKSKIVRMHQSATNNTGRRN